MSSGIRLSSRSVQFVDASPRALRVKWSNGV